MTRWRLLAVGLLLGALPPVASAHSVSTAHVLIEQGHEDGDVLTLDVPVVDAALALPLDADRDDRITWGEAWARRQDLLEMGVDGMRLERGGRACTLHPRGLATRRIDGLGHLTLDYRVACPSQGALRFTYRLFAETDPEHRAFVRVREGASQAAVVTGGNRQGVAIPAVQSSGFSSFFVEGIRHLAIGYDHIAFLVALLLPAGLATVGGAWRPSGSFRTALFHSAAVATAFTLAHSLTLAAAVLGWVRVDSAAVEAVIAGSIIIAALANLRPRWSGRTWKLAFLFGLVHGFGFAGALSALGLPASGRTWALLGFNLGVEIGQLAIVVFALPPLYVAARTRWYRHVGMPLVSLAVAGLALFWLVERVGG
ncbi:HupE/UreJ family protein [Luteimonas pelagia]